MAGNDIGELRDYCLEVAQRAKAAAAELGQVTGAQKNDWLRRSARLLVERSVALAEANRLDLAAAPGYGLDGGQVDRLRLTPARIEAIAKALEEVAMLPDPIGEVIWSSIRPNGLEVHKVRVPLGVIFFIYESRPNVTADAAALCVKSGNAVILRGGKEAAHSSRAIAEILAEAAAEVGLPADAVQLVATADREAVGHFLRMPEYIDLAIPRGGEGLIRRVTAEAKMPVIKHLRRQLPRLPRPLGRPRDGRAARRQRQVPADGRVQRGRVAARACRRGRSAPAAGGQGAHRSGAVEIRGDQRTQQLVAAGQAGDRRRLSARSTWARSSRSRSSIRSTRRSSTSTATARSTPRRS